MLNVKTKKGFALATVLVLMGVILIGMGGLITISRIEARISRSQKESVQAYYVAEAGAQKAIWEIKNNPTLLSQLDAGTLNTAFSSIDQLANLRDLEITATSLQPGRAEIIATGKVREDQFPAQRLVKIQIFRGPPNLVSVLGNNVAYGNGLVELISSSLTITNGDLYSGDEQRYSFSQVEAGSSILGSVDDYLNNSSTVNAAQIRAQNMPPPIDFLAQPGLDFQLLRDNANSVYSPAQFRNLIKGGGIVEFPGPITFINGALNIGTNNLNNGVDSVTIRIHGLFVVNGASASIATTGGGKTINLEILDDTGDASGLVARTNMTISGAGNINIQGVLNASNHFLFSNTNNVVLNGGVVVGWLEFNSAQNTTLIGDPQKIGELFGFISTPSVIQVDHWEEEY